MCRNAPTRGAGARLAQTRRASPADIAANLRRAIVGAAGQNPCASQRRAKVGRVHDFEVLLILTGGAAGQFIHPLVQVPGILSGLKVVEGSEEVIVSRLRGGRDKRSHGKCVDQLIVELLVGQRVGGGLSFFATNRLRRQAAGHGRCFVKHQRFGVDAQVVFLSVADEAFCVHGARQVGVQIGALGHVIKESVKGERPLLTGVVEGSRRSGFTIFGSDLRLPHGGQRQANHECGNGQMNRGAKTQHIAGEGTASFKLWTARVQCTTGGLGKRVLRTASRLLY
jgi:hypothetical protein